MYYDDEDGDAGVSICDKISKLECDIDCIYEDLMTESDAFMRSLLREELDEKQCELSELKWQYKQLLAEL